MPGVGCWGLLGSVCWGFRDKGMESPGRAWHTQEQRGNRQILGPLGVPTPPPGTPQRRWRCACLVAGLLRTLLWAVNCDASI